MMISDNHSYPNIHKYACSYIGVSVNLSATYGLGTTVNFPASSDISISTEATAKNHI
jgi:hypothetical protein